MCIILTVVKSVSGPTSDILNVFWDAKIIFWWNFFGFSCSLLRWLFVVLLCFDSRPYMESSATTKKLKYILYKNDNAKSRPWLYKEKSKFNLFYQKILKYFACQRWYFISANNLPYQIYGDFSQPGSVWANEYLDFIS